MVKKLKGNPKILLTHALSHIFYERIMEAGVKINRKEAFRGYGDVILAQFCTTHGLYFASLFMMEKHLT